VEELGGQDRPLAGHIRARILARITHSVCEVILGFWKGRVTISGSLGEASGTILQVGSGRWSVETLRGRGRM
jgi:hypothetical protein